MTTSPQHSKYRVAWLFPSLARGFYWHPVLAELAKLYEGMAVFTGHWTGFTPGYEGAFEVREVGKFNFIRFGTSERGYDRGIIFPSPTIITRLVEFHPNVVLTIAFSFWTFLALLLKPFYGWKVIIVFDGISPSITNNPSSTRRLWRNVISVFADAFITNSEAGKDYLLQQLGADARRVFSRPYEIPDPSLALNPNTNSSPQDGRASSSRPIFLSVGQLIRRKGVSLLLEACRLLKERGCKHWNLVVVGDGPLRTQLQDQARAMRLEESVHWEGWVSNHNLATYFRSADVFIFPTLEDVWGVAVLEAMLFKKPILCSRWAGVAEMIEDGENGFIFDPHQPETLADLMALFIEQPDLIRSMGERSGAKIRPFTPQTTANHIARIISGVAGQTDEAGVRRRQSPHMMTGQ